jgi:hypothetical protein
MHIPFLLAKRPKRIRKVECVGLRISLRGDRVRLFLRPRSRLALLHRGHHTRAPYFAGNQERKKGMMPLHRSINRHAGTGLVASRRTVVKGALALAGVAALALRGAAAQEATPVAVPEPFAGDTFVAEADDGATHVAVVVAPVAAGADREARIYLCDGQTRNIWVPGVTAAGSLEIVADAATVRATLAAGSVTGEATLPDGTTLQFDAARAEGIAGLYEVVAADGRFEGVAGDGQRLQGAVAGELPDGRLAATALIALPDDTVHVLGFIATADMTGEIRIITLPGGKPVGGPRLVQGVASGSGFVSGSIDLVVPQESDFFLQADADF